MEHDQGKLTSQERFWQARLMSSEIEHRAELSSIHEQLAILKATTEHAKLDLDQTLRQEHQVVVEPKMVSAMIHHFLSSAKKTAIKKQSQKNQPCFC